MHLSLKQCDRCCSLYCLACLEKQEQKCISCEGGFLIDYNVKKTVGKQLDRTFVKHSCACSHSVSMNSLHNTNIFKLFDFVDHKNSNCKQESFCFDC